MEKLYYVYIMNNRPGGALYVGFTSNLIGRVQEHKNGVFEGFTKQYGLKRLVYYETYKTPQDAIAREKQLKHWNRDWKIRLIKTDNPNWKDLSDDF